jgi:alanine racemase
LCEELLSQNFGTASLGEAMEIRKHVSGNYKTYIFSDTELQKTNYRELYNQELIPVIHHMDDLDIFLKECSGLKMVLKFNTGMNRLGLNSKDIETIIRKLKEHGRKSIGHLMSHYSSSYIPGNKRTKTQTQEFESIIKEFKASGIDIEETSMANSGAIEQQIASDYSHIRPGLMLYGPASVEGKWDGRILSELKSNLISVFEVKKGTPIGYGGHVCHADGKVGILPLGYGDGLMTYYSGAEFHHNEYPVKILGRVNMDLMQLFFPSEANIREGDEVVIWNHSQSRIANLSKQMKTIPYQLFCALNERVPRVYL